jgi:hypothetical protein
MSGNTYNQSNCKIMIDRNYEYLKLKRTYIGGSKEKELEIFNHVQHGGPECDWFEYRRILFPYLEDELHVNFSRSIMSKTLSFILLGISFLLGVSHLAILSLITVSLAILFRVLIKFFEKKITETLSSYNMSIDIVKNKIKIMSGLDI